jgi:large subunit ribosomal protein L31e
MAKIERSYNIPLRREWLKSPKHRRSKKAIKAVREFLAKHMKADISEVKIGKHLNEDVWKYGIKNPPHHIKVNAVKEDSGKVFAELTGHKIEEMITKEEKGKKKKEKVEKPKAPKEEKKEEPKEEKKPAEEKPEGTSETKVSERDQKSKISDMPTAVNVKKIEPKEEAQKPAEKAEEKK